MFGKLIGHCLNCFCQGLISFIPKNEPKGEITIVISEKKLDKKTSQTLSESDKRNIETMINKLSIREITDLIGQSSKVSKKKIYDYCLKLKNEK